MSELMSIFNTYVTYRSMLRTKESALTYLDLIIAIDNTTGLYAYLSKFVLIFCRLLDTTSRNSFQIVWSCLTWNIFGLIGTQRLHLDFIIHVLNLIDYIVDLNLWSVHIDRLWLISDNFFVLRIRLLNWISKLGIRFLQC